LPDKNNKPNSKIRKISDSEKSQILSYFLAKNISKISLKNGKLVIEYKDNTQKTITNEDQEQQKYHQIIQNMSSKSLSLSDLQTNNTIEPSTSNKKTAAIYISLVIVAFILGGIFVILPSSKKKKK